MAIAEGRTIPFVGPETIDVAVLETFEYSGPDQEIVTETREFSAVCPYSGLPDFATLTIGSGSEIRYMRILQAGLARLGQVQKQLNGESPANGNSAKPASGSSETSAGDRQKQAESIYSRELSREISLAVRYFEETVRTGAPDRGAIIAAGFCDSATASLSNLTSIEFHTAEAPPGAAASPDDPPSRWHAPIGLCLYEQDHGAAQSAGAGAVGEARCA